jgi:hypothetical protein
MIKVTTRVRCPKCDNRVTPGHSCLCGYKCPPLWRLILGWVILFPLYLLYVGLYVLKLLKLKVFTL